MHDVRTYIYIYIYKKHIYIYDEDFSPLYDKCGARSARRLYTRNRSLSNIGRARCAAINSDFFKIIISKYINYTIGINDNNCVFVCNLILGW